MTARQCKLAIKQIFTQDGEKETALHTGRGTLLAADGTARLCCGGNDALPAQTVSFPFSDRLAVTAENGQTKLCFPGAEEELPASGTPITVDTPMGALSFGFHPLSVENTIDPAAARGELILRYRLTWGTDAVRDAELHYTLLGLVKE